MNKIFTTLCAICFTTSVMAQLYAYSTNGKVQIQREGQWRNVYVSDVLQNEDSLLTEEYGCIIVLDRGNNKKYSLQSTSPQTIQSLIELQGKNAPSLFKEYIQRLYVALLGYDTDETEKLQTSGGVTYRSENYDMRIANDLLEGTASMATDFQVLDQYSLLPVQRIAEGQNIVLQIENNSDKPLYVNCIDTDSEGQRYVLLPFNKVDSLSDIYIPPFSQIRLQSIPISFSPAGSTEELTLIAHPEPFNIFRVIDLLHNQRLNAPSKKLEIH